MRSEKNERIEIESEECSFSRNLIHLSGIRGGEDQEEKKISLVGTRRERTRSMYVYVCVVCVCVRVCTYALLSNANSINIIVTREIHIRFRPHRIRKNYVKVCSIGGKPLD